MKYVCKQKKEEIVNILIDEFKKIQRDLDNARENNWPQNLQDRNFGRYVAMMDLLQKIQIFEEED